MGWHDLNDRQLKWITKFQAYDFEIEFVKRKKNTTVNVLFRTPLFHFASIISTDWKAFIIDKYVKNDFVFKILYV